MAGSKTAMVHDARNLLRAIINGSRPDGIVTPMTKSSASRKSARPGRRRVTMAKGLQTSGGDPAPAAAGRRESPTDQALRAGPGCRRGPPPRLEGCPPSPGGPRRRSGPAFFPTYNPSHERHPSLAWLRAAGRNRARMLCGLSKTRANELEHAGSRGGSVADPALARRASVVARTARRSSSLPLPGPAWRRVRRESLSGLGARFARHHPRPGRDALPLHRRLADVDVYRVGSATSDQAATPLRRSAARCLAP